MDLAEVYSALGRERSVRLVKAISIGALKTYGVYAALKVRSRLGRFNRMRLRKAAPMLWKRIVAGDEALAQELSQAVLVSNLPLVVAALDELGIEHDGTGFFSIEQGFAEEMEPGWERRLYAQVARRFPEELVLLYINHLGWETETLDEPFVGLSGQESGSAAEQ